MKSFLSGQPSIFCYCFLKSSQYVPDVGGFDWALPRCAWWGWLKSWYTYNNTRIIVHLSLTVIIRREFNQHINISQSRWTKNFYFFLVRASAWLNTWSCPSVCLPVCLFQLASGEVSLTILMSNIVGEYRRVFYNYPGPKNEQCHTQTF